MEKYSSNVICSLLAMLLALSSCGSGMTEIETTTEPTQTDTVAAETALTDQVPALDFGGESFIISTGDRYDFEMDVAEQTGEVTSDAIYDRNRKMEERFNVKISSIQTPNPSNHEHPTFVRTSVLADDHAFDMAGIFVYTAGGLVLENLFTNWHSIPYVDLTQAWWVHNINDTFTVDGKLYTAVSDL